MSAADRSTWMEHLPTERCWELLASTPVGRLGVLVNSAPEIYPVNHQVVEGSIVFRTDAGGKLHGLERSPAVCFEVDGYRGTHHEGWSVLVKGRAELLIDPVDRRTAEALDLAPWGLGPKPHWVRIVPAEVTGRRIHTSAAVRSRTRRIP